MNWNNLELPDNPYYQDDAVLIYHGDCREILPQLPKVDLVLTSPPYDNLRLYGGQTFEFNGLPSLIYAVMEMGGCCVWVVGDQTINGSETGSSFKQALGFIDNGFNLHDTMIYEKNWITYPDTARYFNAFEFMFVFSKGFPKTVNLIRDKRNSSKGTRVGGTNRRKDGSLPPKVCIGNIIPEYSIRTNIWMYSQGDKRNIKGHPAQFPEQLVNDHIISWSNSSDLILDPFLGSGTTAYCAKKINRKCIGIEIEEKYCEIAAKRCCQSVMNFDTLKERRR
jgi:DNA modification methylase